MRMIIMNTVCRSYLSNLLMLGLDFGPTWNQKMCQLRSLWGIDELHGGKSKLGFPKVFCCRDILNSWRDILNSCRDILNICRETLNISRYILNICRDILNICRYILNIRRDMKPENVLVGRTERMKENVCHVVDFGLQSHRNEHWISCDVDDKNDDVRFASSRFNLTLHWFRFGKALHWLRNKEAHCLCRETKHHWYLVSIY